MKTLIYLDYNATTPLWPAARDTMIEVLSRVSNASSVHTFGQWGRQRVEASRAEIAASIGCGTRQVVFTSGGTEANALALQFAHNRSVMVSAIEHDCVLAQAPSGSQLIPVGRDGVVDLAALEDMLAIAVTPPFVSIMAANNETGVVQPIEQAALMVRARGGILHVDAAQALGKIDLLGCPADLITVSAHKCGGPQGVGALVIRLDAAPLPLMRGGGQERGWRAGTENIAGICGFAAAVRTSLDTDWHNSCQVLRDQLEAALPVSAVLIGRRVPRLPNTSVLFMPGVEAQTQVMNFDLMGFAVSAGSACSSGKVRASHVLGAMGYDEAVASQTVRVSLGWDTTATEIHAFSSAWLNLHQKLSTQKAA